MSGSTQVAFYFQAGTHAARPAAPQPSLGSTLFYYETDTVHLFYWTGSAWTQVI